MKVTLAITSGPMKGKTFSFAEHETFLFGRSARARCRLPDDPFVSRSHFLLEVNPPRVLIRDLASLNGTILNGSKFGGCRSPDQPEDREVPAERRDDYLRELKHGDQIVVGETAFSVSIEPSQSSRDCGRSIPVEDGAAERLMRLLKEIAATERPRALPAFPGYEIERKIGEGGMGAVYLAKDAGGGPCVIKVIKPDQAASEKDIKRFRDREIPISLGMRHPNVVKYLGGDFSDGVYYLVMEYVEGSDLQRLMEGGSRLDAKAACGIIASALEGLEHIHGQGVVHRDIKPPNILLARTAGGWVPKISDFGLSKDARSGSITGFGEIGGSLPYMAPDQIIDFKNSGPPVDVYSMGATLYELLSGSYVNDFPRNVSVNDFLKIRVQELSVPIRNRQPGIPVAVAEVVDRAVAYDPKLRFRTAREFRDALARAI